MKKFIKITLSVIGISFAGLLVLGAISSSKLNDAAEKAGFDNIEEYKIAKKANISTKSEYDTYLQQQAELDAKAAENGGFLSVDEYKEAKAVNMPTKELYDKYLVQRAELKLAEEQRKEEEKTSESAISESNNAVSKKSNAEAPEVATVSEPDHMKVENVKKAIKDYLGPCSGSACQINIDLLEEYLKKHEDYSQGNISALVTGPSGSKYVEAYLRDGNQIEVYYYTGTMSSMKKQRDIVKIDKMEIIEIYSAALKQHGAEVFEDWYRAPTNGIKALKTNINNFINSKATEYMNSKESKAAEEWNKSD
jgi:hypothetical protein